MSRDSTVRNCGQLCATWEPAVASHNNPLAADGSGLRNLVCARPQTRPSAVAPQARANGCNNAVLNQKSEYRGIVKMARFGYTAEPRQQRSKPQSKQSLRPLRTYASAGFLLPDEPRLTESEPADWKQQQRAILSSIRSAQIVYRRSFR